MLFGFLKSKVSALERHYQLIEAIGKEKDEDKLIKLCIEDISIAEDFKAEYYAKAKKEISDMNLKGKAARDYISLPPCYPGFEKLAIIYEKRKDYDSAINICDSSIRAGFLGKDGSMIERIKRLQVKRAKAMKTEKNEEKQCHAQRKNG